jgi:hypothetical protein
MSRFYDHDIKAARVAYGSFNGMHETKHDVPSWTAHIILNKAFRFTDQSAGQVVNDLIQQAYRKPLNTPAQQEFSTHRGHRTWIVRCVFAPLVHGAQFSIKETTRL